MKCKNCNNILPGGAKFCDKCGVLIQLDPVREVKTKSDISTLKKSVKTAGVRITNKIRAISFEYHVTLFH